MKFCKRCLYPSNHAFGLYLNSEGLCSGCIAHEEKDNIDWVERFERLKILTAEFKNTNKTNYDCVVPVNGGKDSFYVVDVIKNKLGLNPLCVHYNSHFSSKEGVANLAKLRIELGVDLIDKTLSPLLVKKITRKTLKEIGSIYWHVIAGETVFPVEIAVQMKIPLIIWGAHQGLDQTGMFSHNEFVEMTERYRVNFDLMGLSPHSLIDEELNISFNDIVPFIYPSKREIERVGVRGIYLNNYIRWDTRSQHQEMFAKYHIYAKEQTRTFDNFSYAHCMLYADVHDYIKLIKHGYSKIFDNVAREIRLGSLTQEKGYELIKQYVAIKPNNLEKFCAWLGMSITGFNFILDRHRNKQFWRRSESWEWSYNLPEIVIQKDDYNYPFKKSWEEYAAPISLNSSDKENPFVLYGRGLN